MAHMYLTWEVHATALWHMYVTLVHRSSVIPHIILDMLLEVCKTLGTEGVCLKVVGGVLIYPFNWWFCRWVGHQHTNKQFLDNSQKSSVFFFFFFFSLPYLCFMFVFYHLQVYSRKWRLLRWSGDIFLLHWHPKLFLFSWSVESLASSAVKLVCIYPQSKG